MRQDSIERNKKNNETTSSDRREVLDKIEQKLKLLPDLPGCYLMRNANDTIIYVGKAKNLKNRVRSYFLSLIHI